MTHPTLFRAASIYGRALRELPFHAVLRSLGVGEEQVRVALAITTVGELMAAFPDLDACPIIVIDDRRGRVARLDVHTGGSGFGIEVADGTELGMIIDAAQSLRRDVAADVLQGSIHAETREFAFA